MKKTFLILILALFFLSSYSQFISNPPKLQGGTQKYKDIFNQEFYYPQAALDAKAQGEIKVEFTVGIDGVASDFVVLQSVHPLLDSAYIHILKLCVWTPGTHDGVIRAITYKHRQKIKISKYNKLVKKRKYSVPPFEFTPYNNSLKIVDPKQLDQKAECYYKNEKVNIYNFISKYIKIPPAAVKQGIKGVVELEFIVEPSGRINNFNDIVGVGGGCSEEAIRLMKMLTWKPAKKDNEYVRSKYFIKINFGNIQY